MVLTIITTANKIINIAIINLTGYRNDFNVLLNFKRLLFNSALLNMKLFVKTGRKRSASLFGGLLSSEELRSTL